MTTMNSVVAMRMETTATISNSCLLIQQVVEETKSGSFLAKEGLLQFRVLFCDKKVQTKSALRGACP